MKKLLMFILAAFLFVGIVACDGEGTIDVTEEPTTVQVTEAPTEEPTQAPTEEPTTQVPTQEPTTEEPTTEEPTTEEPTTEEPTTEEPTTEEQTEDPNIAKVDSELAAINLTLADLIAGAKLPKASADWSVQFSWRTSNPYIITADGFVNNPPVGSDPALVTLTVRAQAGAYSASKEFEFTVEPYPEVEIAEKRLFDFVGTSTEYVVTDQTDVALYFTQGGELPYIDVETFFTMMEGAIEPELLTFTMEAEDIMKIEYTYEYFDDILQEDVVEVYSAHLNFTDNTLRVDNFDFFAGYVASTESNYGEGLNYVDVDYVDGQEVIIDLGFYNIDLVNYLDGETTVHLMPLHALNIIFMSDIYYQAYFNGDMIYGVDTFDLSSGNEETINLIHESSYNNKEMSVEVKLATYNSLALIMDYFYGLKPDKNYDTYYERLYASMKSIITGTDNNLYNKIFGFMYGMDDLHTSHVFYGYYDARTMSGISISDLGPETTAFYEGLWAVQDLLTAKFGGYTDDDLPEYSLINDDTVAVIHITGFTIDSPDAFKATLDALPETVEDVVIDLSYNTGGNIGAVMRIFGYMTEEQYNYHSQNPADGSAVTYYIESDYVAYDYNWYVLTSSVTFSAANMFASMAKELGIPVIGQQSSGGASSIGAFITPDGSAVMISTNNVLSTRIGNEIDGYQYVSVESGVPVDYFLSNVASDDQLINAINEHKAQTE
ncbi:hypothetical protein HF295_03340 [Hujiaoplasma nucleasis]|uniref:Tail specific protease domain-containing protein n=1 Tax=Hujiaoplasma nucleasis TaxID=2725268 RepID=A0A7L6N320_9MOLU|nr:S41 family peptidase [Hujiaoplasma nucleasis]QLY39941.1 hypothetical protein HF295_03340 [Hujiaoplasma nucleasis]